jgi:protein TonB
MGMCLLLSALCHVLLILFPQNFSPVSVPKGNRRIAITLVDKPSAFPAKENGREAQSQQTTKTAPPPPRHTPTAVIQPKPLTQKMAPAKSKPVRTAPPPRPKSIETSPSDEKSSPPPQPPASAAQAAKKKSAEIRKPQGTAGAGGHAVPQGPVLARFGAPNGPRVEHLTQPMYPPRAMRLRKEGRVLLQLHIGHSGAVRSAEVIESAGYGFDESALEAVLSSRFSPATNNGRPVDSLALLPVQFVLEPQR